MTFDIGELLRAINAPIGDVAPTCVCGVPVRQYRDTCPQCRQVQRAADRRLLLGAAMRSLPAIPWAVWGGDWTKTSERSIVATLGHWTREKGNLLLCAPSGAGKTTGAIARSKNILSATEKRGTPDDFRFACGIRFATAADLATARRQHALGQGEPWEIEEAIEATLLILDELGFEPQVDTAIPELADIRYRKNRLTITTTGLRPNELTSRYGEATVRKLIGQGKLVSAFEEKQS